MHTVLKVAVACALALTGAHAFALTPSEIQTAAGNGTLVTLYVSGATTTDDALEVSFKLDSATARVCVPNTLDIYYYKSISGSVSQRALTCTAGFSGTGITSGTTKLVLLKESAGSSIEGIVHPAADTPLPFIDLVGTGSNFATACASVTSSAATLPNAIGTFRTRDCGHVLNTSVSTVIRSSFVPQAGISEVDPNMFVGTSGVTGAHASALTRKRTPLAVTYNPIVSVPMFIALQRAYGYIGATASESTASLGTVPSLPSAVLRAIFNGSSVLNANEVSVNDSKLSTQLSGLDQSGDIYLCRRGDTSGAMASFKLHFLGQGCSKTAGNIQFVAADAPACTSAGCTWASTYFNSYVFAGASTDDVRACVDYQSSEGRLAVGIAPTTAKPGTISNRYRYIRVDEVEPTLKAVMEGDYEFFTEPTFNDKYSNTATTGAQTLWDKLQGAVGAPVVLSEVNRTWRTSVALTGTDDGTADTGLLGAASTANAAIIINLLNDARISGAEVRGTPMNSQTRHTLGVQPNNCNRPYQAYP